MLRTSASFGQVNASFEQFARAESRRFRTLSVDIPTNDALAQHFYITALPTVMVFQAGAPVLTGAVPRTIDVLPAIIDRLEAEPGAPIPPLERPATAARTIAALDPAPHGKLDVTMSISLTWGSAGTVLDVRAGAQVSLNIDHGNADPLAHLAADALDHLLLFNTPVTAADIAHLTGLTLLCLMNTGTDDCSIERLAGLTELRQLDIADRTSPDDPIEPESAALTALPHTLVNGPRGRADLISLIRPPVTPMPHHTSAPHRLARPWAWRPAILARWR